MNRAVFMLALFELCTIKPHAMATPDVVPLTVTRLIPAVLADGLGWSSGAGFSIGPSTIAEATMVLNPYIADGATLTGVSFHYRIPQGHGGLPTFYGILYVKRIDAHFGSSYLSVSNSNTFPPEKPNNVTDYERDGEIQEVSLVLTQNNVVDKSQYIYVLSVGVEWGVNALPGTILFPPQVTMTLGDPRPW